MNRLEHIAKRIGRSLLSHRTPTLDWKSLLKAEEDRWLSAVQYATGGSRVLMATSTGRHQGLTSLESILATALTLRGARVEFFLCDALLPACMETTVQHTHLASFVRHGPQASVCDACYRSGRKMLSPLGLPIHTYSRWITPDESQQANLLASSLSFDQIGNYTLDGLAVGEHALAGTLRFFIRGMLEGVAEREAVLRRYFHASLLTAFAMQRILDQNNYDVVCFHHGIYVPQGVIGEVARHRGIRVVNWNPAYRKQTFIFTHGDTYHHKLMEEPVENWEAIPWTENAEEQVMAYLKSRWYGTEDWIWFHEDPTENLEEISRELGVDFSKPSVGLLTNVMWDAQLHYPANAFPNMLDWVLRTIRYFIKRPDLQLIIRAHPAEVRGTLRSRQPIVDEIGKIFPSLPDNIILIPPESQVSTYAVMMQCDSVIIYGTKTGVELSSVGIPVIVAGEAWIRNKGITRDASSAEEYFAILDNLPSGRRMSDEQTQRARKYAFHFFFRRMIPLPFMEPRKGWPPYTARLSGLDNLLPGRVLGLDVICEGILKETPFIYPAEDLPEQQSPEKAHPSSNPSSISSPDSPSLSV